MLFDLERILIPDFKILLQKFVLSIDTRIALVYNKYGIKFQSSVLFLGGECYEEYYEELCRFFVVFVSVFLCVLPIAAHQRGG